MFLIPPLHRKLKLLRNYTKRFIDYVLKETIENCTKIVPNETFDNHLEDDYISFILIKLETYMRTHMRTHMSLNVIKLKTCVRSHMRTHMSCNLIKLETYMRTHMSLNLIKLETYVISYEFSYEFSCQNLI